MYNHQAPHAHQAGNTHRVHVNHRANADGGTKDMRDPPQYVLGDGSRVKRIDNDCGSP